MRYLAGLDVSLEETAICVVDETGWTCFGKVESSP